MANLDYFGILSQFLLYTEVQFDGAMKVAKNCLKIDNEFKTCGKLSKFYSKFQDFFKVLEEYSIIQGHYYLNSNDNGQLQNEELVDPKIDYQFVLKFLFSDELQYPKLTDVNYHLISKPTSNTLNSKHRNSFKKLGYLLHLRLFLLVTCINWSVKPMH